ncbi:Peptidase S10 serine carboxypeptidase, partial [Trinorchestia longiramus]
GATAPLDEDFGYVTVRPGAHMFWVTYHVDQPGDWTDYPLILWLQGGPGSSGVGYGNFEELGPYYVNGSLREYAWTKKANLMFVDNPVGTGYSYVDSLALLTTTNQQIADDMVALLKSVFTDYPDMSTMPFFIYCESYGGKMNVDIALALNQAIADGEIVSDFRGIALGDSWISPMDSVNTWGPYLYAMGYVNEKGRDSINLQASSCQALADAGEWLSCTDCWSTTETVVILQTGGVNFYNVLATEDIYLEKFQPHSRDLSYMSPAVRSLYKRHVEGFQTRDALDDFMNGAQAEHWNIPDDVTWGGQSGSVFNRLAEDFMKPVVTSVVELLENTDLLVNVFTGDLDLICDTPGTYRWIENMEWSGKADFDNTRRKTFHVSQYSNSAGFVQQSGNFAVFTILRSGHMVPTDAPEAAFVMIDQINEFAGLSREAGKTKIAPKQIKHEMKKSLTMEKSKVTKQEDPKAKGEDKSVPKTPVKESPKVPVEKPKTPEAQVMKVEESKQRIPQVAQAQADIARMRNVRPGQPLEKKGKIDRTPVLDRKIRLKQKQRHYDEVQMPGAVHVEMP